MVGTKKSRFVVGQTHVFLVNPHGASSCCCFELTDLINRRNLTQELTALTCERQEAETLLLLPCKIIILTHETHQTSASYNESVSVILIKSMLKLCQAAATTHPPSSLFLFREHPA